MLNFWVACFGWSAGWVHTAGGCTRTWAPGIGGALRDAQAAVDVGATTFGIARWQDRGLGDSTVARAGFHSSISRTIYHALRGGLCYQDQRARKGQGAAVAGIAQWPLCTPSDSESELGQQGAAQREDFAGVLPGRLGGVLGGPSRNCERLASGSRGHPWPFKVRGLGPRAGPLPFASGPGRPPVTVVGHL